MIANIVMRSNHLTLSLLCTHKIFRSLDLVPSKLLLTQRNAFLTEAACYLISESISLETISSASIPSPIPYWRNVIDHSIKHYNDKVHAAAASALSSLSKIKDCSQDVKR